MPPQAGERYPRPVTERIFLSPPDMTSLEQEALSRAFAGGWIAPLGPEVDAFEAELAAYCDRKHAVALSSGTAAPPLTPFVNPFAASVDLHTLVYTLASRASGEIGRHAGFRFLCLTAWGFKSPLAHHILYSEPPSAMVGGSLRELLERST